MKKGFARPESNGKIPAKPGFTRIAGNAIKEIIRKEEKVPREFHVSIIPAGKEENSDID